MKTDFDTSTLLALLQRCCQGLLALAATFSLALAASEPPLSWMLMDVEIKSEVTIDGVDYKEPVTVNSTTTFFRDGFLLEIEDGESLLVVQRSFETGVFRFWKRGQDRIFLQYSEGGVEEDRILVPHADQYPFYLRPDQNDVPGLTVPGYTFKIFSTSRESKLELTVPLLEGFHTLNINVGHKDGFAETISRDIVKEATVSTEEFKAGDRWGYPSMSARMSEPYPGFSNVPKRIECTIFDTRGKAIMSANHRIVSVRQVAPPESLEGLTTKATEGLSPIPNHSRNPERHPPQTAVQVASTPTAVNIERTLVWVSVVGVFLAAISISLYFIRGRAVGQKRHRALSLVELLVVVGILTVLVSIGAINFIHAQVRTKVAKSHSEMRLLMNGVLSYRMDYNSIPRMTISGGPYYDRYEGKGAAFQPIETTLGYWMTTPVAYVSAFDLLHPFDRGPGEPIFTRRTYGYHERYNRRFIGLSPEWGADPYGMLIGTDFYLASAGPMGYVPMPHPRPIYDPTNGVVSLGFLIMTPVKNSIEPR